MPQESEIPATCPVEECSFGEEGGLNYGKLTEHVCRTDDPAHNDLQAEREWYCYDT
ncbi:MAG: hypothetical protein ABEJ79_06155 [Halolamina sp.]